MAVIRKFFAVLLLIICGSYAHPDASNALEPWERPHSDFIPEARQMMKARCQAEAGEQIFSTIEDVPSFFRIDESPPGRYFVGGIDVGSAGVSNTHPHYMFFRLGLDFIEFEFGEREKIKTEKTYGRFDLHSRKTEQADKLSSVYAVRFKSIATPSEERLGLHGRQTDVIEIASGKILATRKEFIWLNPDPRRAVGGHLCPSLQRGQATPGSFLSQVINPDSYGCWHKTEKDYDFVDLDRRLKKIRACEDEYWQRKQKKE